MEASDTVPAVGSQPMTHFSNNTTTNARDSGDQQSGHQPSPPKRSKGKSKNRRSAETSVQDEQQPGPQPSPPKRSKGKSKNKRSAATTVLDAQHSAAEARGRSGKSQPSSLHLTSNRSSPHDVSQPDIVLVVHANGVTGGGSSCPASMNKAKRSGLQLHRKSPAASSKKRWSTDGECVLGLPLPPRVKKWLTRDHSIEGKEIRNILILGASFQLMFTAYFAIQVSRAVHKHRVLYMPSVLQLYSLFPTTCCPGQPLAQSPDMRLSLLHCSTTVTFFRTAVLQLCQLLIKLNLILISALRKMDAVYLKELLNYLGVSFCEGSAYPFPVGYLLHKCLNWGK